MTDDLYLALRQITFGFIDADKGAGKEVKFENINSYIDRAMVGKTKSTFLQNEKYNEWSY